jgi:hypothetical protein
MIFQEKLDKPCTSHEGPRDDHKLFSSASASAETDLVACCCKDGVYMAAGADRG